MAAPAKKSVPKETEAPTRSMAVVQNNMNAMEVSAGNAANAQEVVASDVLIPRLLLGQGISPMVTQRKAQIGDLVRSTTLEKLGSPEAPIDVVPLKFTNTWINFEKVPGQNRPQFRGQEHRGITERDKAGNPTATNEDLPWEYKGANGADMLRRKAITLFALIPADIASYEKEILAAVESGEAPDLNKTVLPVVITFQSTSFKHAGKKCATFFNSVKVNDMKLKEKTGGKGGVVPFQYLLTLSAKEEKDGDAAWYVYDFGVPKALVDSKATPEVQAQQKLIREEAARWVTILNNSQVRVDDSGEVDESVGRGSSHGASAAAEMEV